MKCNTILLVAVCFIFVVSSFCWAEQSGKKLIPVEIISAEASSVENEDLTQEKSIDNDFLTRWASEYGDLPQWLVLDMGVDNVINTIAIAWEAAAARVYEIQVSLDGSDWKNICEVSNGEAGIDIISFPSIRARYVRIYCIERTTEYGYSIHEVKLFGR